MKFRGDSELEILAGVQGNYRQIPCGDKAIFRRFEAAGKKAADGL